MHSFLITGGTDEKRHQNALAICSEQAVNQFDITVIERAEIGLTAGEIKRKASIGIEEVKTMQKTLHLKPFQSEKKGNNHSRGTTLNDGSTKCTSKSA